jgi:hypothetical protein
MSGFPGCNESERQGGPVIIGTSMACWQVRNRISDGEPDVFFKRHHSAKAVAFRMVSPDEVFPSDCGQGFKSLLPLEATAPR